MKPTASHDLIVIGGGSAGHAAARTAAGLGAKVALIESAEPLGGLCILRGCMPSKTLIETANRMRAIRDAARFGIRVAEPELDVDALRDRVRSLVSDFRQHRESEMTSGRYKLLHGSASFTSEHEIEFATEKGESRTLTATTFVIATGSTPSVPPIPGLAGTPYWTSDHVVHLPFLPKHLAVLGSGAIGMECAHLFEGLGSQVTVIARGDSIMGKMDPEIGTVIEAESGDRGIRFLKKTDLKSVTYRQNHFSLSLEGAADSLEADALLVATGRTPATAHLGLEGIGITLEDGRILIDDRCTTSLSHIFAAGDCASPVPVVHLAVIQGEVAGKNAIRLAKDGHRDTAAVWNRKSAMSGWFTEPQCVEIGMSEKEAQEKGITVLTGRKDYSDQGKGIITGCQRGFVKVIADAENGRLLGACGTGPLVIETAHILQAAIELGVSAQDYLAIPHYHPTLAEAWHRAVADLADRLPVP
ncbi:dihydrolipoyl dehydrogenase family protein [Luteolibacter luteus]|uniref:NAD(P)/FAD-dependent oxidoreductase n=1 Tax=Luteolibacter luteus TaxID=2728835 RepID=A0A858RIP0_9BACT|nr:NAD(P)/FAD-dependent oxidoreductase [Luteolibacter luteus]QJE96404.1 NAD(P)/FAD-dependent oxidoreductase [Luteolibacter luteus]